VSEERLVLVTARRVTDLDTVIRDPKSHFSARGGSLRKGTRRAEAWSARGWHPKASRQFAAARRRPAAGAPSPKPPTTTTDRPRRPPTPHRGCAASVRLGFGDVPSGDDHGTTAREHRSSTGRRLPSRHVWPAGVGEAAPGVIE
jgi:hypothetical protein